VRCRGWHRARRRLGHLDGDAHGGAPAAAIESRAGTAGTAIAGTPGVHGTEVLRGGFATAMTDQFAFGGR
jgi:hypothetical protein